MCIAYYAKSGSIEFAILNLSQMYIYVSEIFKISVLNSFFNTKKLFEFVGVCCEFTKVILQLVC